MSAGYSVVAQTLWVDISGPWKTCTSPDAELAKLLDALTQAGRASVSQSAPCVAASVAWPSAVISNVVPPFAVAQFSAAALAASPPDQKTLVVASAPSAAKVAPD